MDDAVARGILFSLVERAETSSEKVFLTSHDVAAIRALLQGQTAVDAVAPPTPPTQPNDHIPLHVFESSEHVKDALLCVDFGTSFSKAFATIDNGFVIPTIIDLPIGGTSEGEENLITPSEMLIDGGKIYFGKSARILFDSSSAKDSRLIDSFKQYMTLESDVAILGKSRLTEQQDPDQKFSRRDILVLFLAYLNYLAERELIRKGYTADFRRRFAHPAWNASLSKANEAEMGKMMAEAVLIGRSIGDQFDGAVQTSTARALLDSIHEYGHDLPYFLIGDPVREATAASAGALLGVRENSRETFVVVDIGAGTTDVAGGVCVNNPDWDRPRVFEIEPAASATKQAGNVLDQALVRLCLLKSSLEPNTTEYSVAAEALRRQRRVYKERLFDSGTIAVELPTDEVVQVSLDEFLQTDLVQTFVSKLKELVAEAACAVVGDEDHVVLIATGGGAHLPFVKQIADSGVNCGKGLKRVRFEMREPILPDLAELYPDLERPYPQIAVALGGALPSLPEQKASMKEGLTKTPPMHIAPMYKS